MLTSEQIEKQIELLNQPKVWIHKQKPVPSHKYAHSSRCVFCMSIQHRSEKCSTFSKSTFSKGGAKNINKK
jgi:hypothetical protein